MKIFGQHRSASSALKSAAFALALSAVSLAGATTLSERFPTGSMVDRDQARSALKEADAEQARFEHEFAVREAECHRRFFVNRCLERLRDDREAAEREVRRVRLEARDLQRRLDAQDAARQREAQQAEAAARAAAERPAVPADTPRALREPREPVLRDAAPRASGRTPEEEAASREARAAAEARHRERVADAERRAADSTDNIREYEERQAKAAQAAAAKEEERLKNEERRAERRRKLEEQEARREEIRKRAAEAARSAGQ
jgi:hypothetical protein